MKWREVKILCAGLCVCSVIAGVDAISQDISEKEAANKVIVETSQEAIENDVTNPVASTITDMVNHTLVEQVSADVERHMTYEVGSAMEEESAANEEAEENLVVADVTNYVNVRSLPSEEGEILGKLYDDSVGRMLGEENGWYQIQSGSVTGYVKAEFVLTGEAAKNRAAEVGQHFAEVTTTTLKVRKEPTMESAVLGLVPLGDTLTVLENSNAGDDWAKIDFEEGTGYVSTDFVRLYTEYVEAESKEEEAARLKKEAEERKKAEEAAKQALLAQQEANKKPASNSGNNANSESDANSGNSSSSNTSLGQDIANYAMQFIGNPYVYGGTSLTNGADCSGFVQSVYKNFGISLPRTSGEQGKSGRAVDGVANAEPGDLVWYSGHIGIYIGDEKIVHASNPKNGIITSNVYYRKILGIRRIV